MAKPPQKFLGAFDLHVGIVYIAKMCLNLMQQLF
jgi:hypothetical protein